ncbi:MAG: AMP-binding protein [Verrucomicrobiota bacterium]
MNSPTPHPAFPGAVWPAIPQAPAAALLAVLGQLAESQFMTPEQLAMARRPQVEALMDHAGAQLPFWRERLQAAGLDPKTRNQAALSMPEWDERWASLPILTRAEVQSLDRQLRAGKLPDGHGNVGESVTSGSSGRPVRIARSTLDYFYWQAFQLREHVWRGRDMSGRFLSILRDERRERMDESVHLRSMADWGPPASVVWPTGPSFLLDYRTPIRELVRTICELKPDYVCTFPSLLLEILRHARGEGIKLPPLREAIGVGEASPPELAGLCREIWDAPLASTYTAAETGAMAYQCREGGRWHLQSEKSIIEVLDSEGHPCAPGTTGRVIVTPLHNFAMPLLRYEIGDLATVGEGPCACGRTLPILDAIPGRARDLLLLPSGELRPPYYGHGAVMQVRSIRQHQVIQTTRNHVCFRLVVAQPLTREEEGHVIKSATNALGGAFGVSIEYVDEILRSPNGKFAEFERRLDSSDE